MKSFFKFSSPKTSYTVYRKRMGFKNIIKKSQFTTEEISPDRKHMLSCLCSLNRFCALGAARTVWSRREIVLPFVKVRFSHAQDWGVECSSSFMSLEYVKEQEVLPRLALLSDFPFTKLQSRQCVVLKLNLLSGCLGSHGDMLWVSRLAVHILILYISRSESSAGLGSFGSLRTGFIQYV